MVSLSRFCHPFKIKNQIILFHALNFEQCIFDASDISFSGKNNTVVEISSSIGKNAITQLKEKRILINSKSEDEELLNSFRALIKKPYISTAYFFITNDCNLACTYCFERQSVPDFFKKETMTKDTVIRGLDFFVRLAKLDPKKFHEKKTIIFYGGEPFLNKKTLFFAIQTIRAYVDQGKLPENTQVIVVSNGVLLTPDDIDYLKKNSVTLTLSIDGNKKANANRVFPNGQEAFQKIVKNYKLCRDAHLDINIACTITPETINQSKESFDFFINDMKINNIGFNALLDNGIVDIPENYDEDAAKFIVKAHKKLAQHQICESRVNRRIQVFNRKKPCIFDCNAQGGRQIAIAPNGEVGICHEHIADRKHFITTIDDDFIPGENPVYLEWMKRSPLNIEKCFDCPAIGICGGGCVINTESKTHSIWKPDRRFCMQTLDILKYLLSLSILQTDGAKKV
jgi:uncharacterized protein